MRVKITGASGLVWYKDQIGNTFTCHDRSESYYGLGVKGMTDLTIQKWDCEILPDEQPPQPEPFDLERALKGEPVCITCGILVDKFTFVDSIQMFVGEITTDERYRYQAPTANTIKMWDKSGRVYSGFSDGDQLYMAPKEPQVVARWVNVYEGYGHFNTGTTTYESKESAAAKKNNSNTNKYIGSFPIQITLNKQP